MKPKVLKLLKKAWAVQFLKRSVFTASFFLLLSAPVCIAADAESELVPERKPKVQAESVDSYLYQQLRYDVYAGGFHAVEGYLNLDYREKNRYDMLFGATTHGVLGTLAPWSGTFESKGWILEDGYLTPELHESISIWRDEKEVKSYNYTKDGKFKDLVTTYTHKKPKTKIPEEELTKGTTDALTAMMMVMEKVADGGKCEGIDDVFDGKRRFQLIFRHKRFVNLEKTRYNVYSGPAAECTVEVKPVAGGWHSKPRGWLSIQEQGRDRGMMPTVWIAQVRENAVAVPVRVRVKTAYGTMFMHMTGYESGSMKLSLK